MRVILVKELMKGGAERQISIIAERLNVNTIYVFKNAVAYTIHLPIVRMSLRAFLQLHNERGVIISFLQLSNFCNVLFGFISKKRVILSERSTPSKVFVGFKKIYLFCIRLLYPHADCIISNSLGVKNDLVENFHIPSRKVVVIYNAFDQKEIDRSIKNTIPTSIYTLATIGRLDESKGYWHMLRVIAHLKKMQLHYSLAIIGDGKYRMRLLHYASDLGLTVCHPFSDEDLPSNDKADIIFLGIQDNPFKYIARAKLFVLTSLYEGFPNVLVESMICGTPVISADCRSGPREILAPDTDFRYETNVSEYAKYGILMPVLDGVWRSADEPLTQTEQIWADEIVKVLHDDELRRKYSELGKQRAQDFSIEKIIPQWERVIQDVEEGKLK